MCESMNGVFSRYLSISYLLISKYIHHVICKMTSDFIRSIACSQRANINVVVPKLQILLLFLHFVFKCHLPRIKRMKL